LTISGMRFPLNESGRAQRILSYGA
jgi:hypothetical protein